MIGFLLDANRDSAGGSKSVFFAGTDEGRLLKQDFGTTIDSQIYDLEAMLRTSEMEARGVDRDFRQLYKDLTRRPGEGKSDWGRRVLRIVFRWDIRELS